MPLELLLYYNLYLLLSSSLPGCHSSSWEHCCSAELPCRSTVSTNGLGGGLVPEVPAAARLPSCLGCCLFCAERCGLWQLLDSGVES